MQTKSIGGGHGEDLMTKLSLDYQQSYHYISLAKEKKKKNGVLFRLHLCNTSIAELMTYTAIQVTSIRTMMLDL